MFSVCHVQRLISESLPNMLKIYSGCTISYCAKCDTTTAAGIEDCTECRTGFILNSAVNPKTCDGMCVHYSELRLTKLQNPLPYI